MGTVRYIPPQCPEHRHYLLYSLRQIVDFEHFILCFTDQEFNIDQGSSVTVDTSTYSYSLVMFTL